MKAVKLLVICLLCSTNGFGQKIIDSLNYWNYLEVQHPTCEKNTKCSGTIYTNHFYLFCCDTIINNEKYKLLIDSISNSRNFWAIGFFRDDSSHKKIYYLSMVDSEEILLYDFTIKKDSMFYAIRKFAIDSLNSDMTIDTFYSAKVINIDSVVLNDGSKRLRIQFDDIRYNWLGDIDTTEWIEGIGSNHGLLYFWYYNFLCFKHNDVLSYSNKYGYDCSYSGPKDIIKSQNLNELYVFPNPAKDVLNIQSEKIMQSIILFNISGEKVCQYYPKNTRYQINLTNIKSGLYIINIDNNFKKVIIE